MDLARSAFGDTLDPLPMPGLPTSASKVCGSIIAVRLRPLFLWN